MMTRVSENVKRDMISVLEYHRHATMRFKRLGFNPPRRYKLCERGVRFNGVVYAYTKEALAQLEQSCEELYVALQAQENQLWLEKMQELAPCVVAAKAKIRFREVNDEPWVNFEFNYGGYGTEVDAPVDEQSYKRLRSGLTRQEAWIARYPAWTGLQDNVRIVANV